MHSAKLRAAVVLYALVFVCGAAFALTWTESSWQDFSDGKFESNLYVSYRDGGTVEFVARFDLNNDGWMDLVCSEGYGSSIRVYFGDSSGFSPSRSRVYAVPGGGGCDIADLNYDGYADLVHSGWRARNTGTIYWGTDSGPDPQDTTELPARTSEATTTADIDADGYLDIVFSSEDGISYIYWGSAAGYSPSNVMLLNTTTDNGHNWVTADMNKDGYLDLLTCCCNSYTRQPIFYFGPNRTYRTEWLDFSAGGGFNAQGITVADFDRNGWLDIVYTGHNNITQAWVYWGSDSGFTFQDRTVINTDRCFGGSAAYDFNNDGLLDLLFFRGSYYSPSQFKPIIYYNTGSFPYFSDAQSSTIGTLTMNSTGGRVADFNNDGNVDIYLDDFRNSDAKVLWGPDWNTVTQLPCASGHHGMARQIGNIYDRSYQEDYVSSVFDATGTTSWQTVTWDDSIPVGSAVALAVRTGTTAAPDSTWSEWYAVANGDTVPDSLDSRCIQYRATFRYQTPALLPMLYEVRIDYGPGLISDVGPTAILAPTDTVDSGLQVMPAVVVRNFGTNSATFPATLLIGSGYSQTLSDTLAAGATDTVQFPAWTAGPVGTLRVVCFTGLSGDENPANDTITDSVHVRRVLNLDVGPIEILSPPGTSESGGVYVPSAIVRNFGLTSAMFPVTMVVGAGYVQTAQETLAPGLADTVVFPPWTAEPIGSIAVTCFTALVGDENPANDTIRDSVRVVGPPEHDVGATAILSPTGTVHTGDTVIPMAR
ncbi:MAG: VCBS repeat-containing protein, partial [candidate division WOR-3 bacterium]|nr:VCBS repeat-containing protein [candidate division WOR-3 bacterium]